ncbi:MAG: hypothetical protein QS721_07695 [Candidatus Endonucleobacter sp. (ex Gigantidas childressi)]|nr:hypothetical protein [Candidatus Endonucleobacter sp. (ex Gigantidas childressi)]
MDGYGAESVHALASQRRVTATKFSKTDERHMPIIKKGLLLGWSPENISFRMKVEVPDIALSHTTVYKRVATTKCVEALCIRIYHASARGAAKVVSVRLGVSRPQISSIFPISPHLLICGLV